MKRRGNRRYYQHEEVLMIRQIRSLLYEQGYTISGARVQLQSESKRTTVPPLVVTPEASAETAPSTDALLAYQLKISQNMLNVVIKDMIRELESVLNVLGKNTQVRGI
jgi:DNA-binding transcriptional MerR regulator